MSKEYFTQYGIDISEQLSNILSEELSRSINNDIIGKIRNELRIDKIKKIIQKI